MKKFDETKQTPGTLKIGEFHPAAKIAQRYISEHISQHPFIEEALASTALSGNRTVEIAYETLRRLLDKEPVSDRYLMGLAWVIYELGNRK